MMVIPDNSRQIEAVRRFNRFYTKQIGVVTDQYLESPFSLTEVRVIFELAHGKETTAAELAAFLNIDPGYLSRILAYFKKLGLIIKTSSSRDRRQSILQLTEAGVETFTTLNTRSRAGIEVMLSKISSSDQARLLEAMHTIEGLLGGEPESKVSYILRPPHAGDMGWVVQSHAALYAEEYNWDEQFEALTAEIVAAYIKNFDPKFERCWIAEKDGENIGSIFVVKKSDTVAKLRLLLVQPKARGLGVGKRLVEESIRFARQAGYQKMTLWTNSILSAARHIYGQVGFTLVESEPHHSFGQDLVGETWELEL
jgi:DNA-binding MarR family transcriptional regulator/GNAT superfamily N-acetyltransferase